jgi:nucleoside-diphosphate-sugar epimerase
MDGKPSVLVLGATGFIGRNLVKYLVEGSLAQVTAVDKTPPNCAYLPKDEEKMMDDVFVQKNLINHKAVASLWDDKKYDYVINCAGETKYGHTEEVYDERVVGLSITCAKEAAKQGVKRFIELSTAQVYGASNKEKDEKGSINPWTTMAKAKLKVEQELAKIDGLDYIIVRPSTVYGPADRLGLAPRIICGAIYQHLDEPMKFLWNADLQLNTVHVRDVVRAIFHLCTNGKSGDIYNLSDKNKTDQGKINDCLQKMFGIKTKFFGKLKSQAAKTIGMDKVTKDVNDKHVAPWSDMCKKAGIAITPLSPYLDKELLYNQGLSINGSAIESTGFKYEVPNMTDELLREWVKYYVDLKLFPDGYLK